MRLRAAIIGHSYVRRLGDHARRHGCSTPTWFQLNRLFREIAIFGRSGYTVGELAGEVSAAGSLHPDIVIINCGTNDLCQPDCDVERVVQGLISYAHFLRVSYQVKVVIIMGAIRRTRCRGTPKTLLDRRLYDFNGLLKSLTENVPGIQYGVMKGFWRDPETKAELPVDAYTSDGIHPGPDEEDEGFIKYKRNIRRCLLSAVALVLSPGGYRRHFWGLHHNNCIFRKFP